MSDSPVWNIQATRSLIDDLYGKDQMFAARPSLNSVVDRRNIAHYHFHEAMNRFEQHILDIKDYDPVEVALCLGDQETESKHAQRMHEFGAHVQACVHSLHTIPDIMAHAIYFGLGMNLDSPIEERRISARTVEKKLADDRSLSRLHGLFKSLFTDGDFRYLEALNNHGKHRSIVRTAVWSDLTGEAKDPYTAKFTDFHYDGTQHLGRDIRNTITNEYDRIAKGIVDCGIELWTVLTARKGSA